MFKESKEGQTHSQNDGCGDQFHNWNPCIQEVTRLSVNEFLPFEQIEPFKRLASILDNKVKETLSKKIDLFSKHCENKKAQNKCNSCIVLGDLKIKCGIKP